jgi:hypothetical protein
MKSSRSMRTSAARFLFGIVTLCIAALGFAGPAAADEKPCPTFAGIQHPCTFALKPPDFTGQTSYWIDTDGVNPGVAGCHIGVRGMNDRTPNGRFFGEYCTSAGLLVESNPESGKIHDHNGDIGHPYLVNCNAWCQGRGSAGGVCNPRAPAPAPCNTAARCECR